MSDGHLIELPRCPQCGAIVGHKGHICRARSERPNWGEQDPSERIVTDPDAVSEHIADVRAALAAHRPPEAAPAAREAVLRTRPVR